MIERPADKVIRLFGGVSPVAEVVKTSTVQVHRWTYPKAKGGHDGMVPGRHHETLLAAAKERGISLTIIDLVPFLADHTLSGQTGDAA